MTNTAEQLRIDTPIYFDRAGDALAPAHCLEVTTEADWLRAALEPGPLLIRGHISDRAMLFYQGRNRLCVALQSPTAALHGLDLEAEGIAWIRGHWGTEFETRFLQLAQPLRPASLLAALFDTAPVSWFAAPARESAAQWLAWLAQLAQQSSTALAPLFRAQAQSWQSSAAPEIAPLFAPSDSRSAQTLLRAWLGLDEKPRDFASGAGAFPLEVDSYWKERARTQWLSDLAGRGAVVWDELRARPALGKALLGVAAEATATYLMHHPRQIEPALLSSLRPHLASESWARLHDLVPPAAPSTLSPDAAPDAALEWFENEYWPFRRWQARAGNAGDSAHRDAVKIAARSFGSWFLGFYPRALASGQGAEHLVGKRAQTWRATKAEQTVNSVTLFAIVDGLHAGDALDLLARLHSATKRLELLEQSHAFTAIPTITEIAKPALRWGLPPREAAPFTDKLGAFESNATAAAGTRAFEWPGGANTGRELREYADPSVLGAAQAGEVWVWNILDLDSTYHKNFPPATIQTKAASVLDNLAARLAAACQAVPDHLALRVVISADHGRLPATSARCHPVPAGCKAHGRAALVTDSSAAPALAFTGQDYIWESDAAGERVWLHPQRFGLNAPAVLCADENAFEIGSGAREEHFSHGGLWPEEVIVPWLVLARDSGTPHVEITFSGRAKAGAVGTLKLEARNGSEMNLIVQEARVRFGTRVEDERVVGISQSLPALSALAHPMVLERWPDSQSAERCQAVVVVGRPDGSRFEVVATVALESEELYRASNILDDFN